MVVDRATTGDRRAVGARTVVRKGRYLSEVVRRIILGTGNGDGRRRNDVCRRCSSSPRVRCCQWRSPWRCRSPVALLSKHPTAAPKEHCCRGSSTALQPVIDVPSVLAQLYEKVGTVPYRYVAPSCGLLMVIVGGVGGVGGGCHVTVPIPSICVPAASNQVKSTPSVPLPPLLLMVKVNCPLPSVVKVPV